MTLSRVPVFEQPAPFARIGVEVMHVQPTRGERSLMKRRDPTRSVPIDGALTRPRTIDFAVAQLTPVPITISRLPLMVIAELQLTCELAEADDEATSPVATIASRITRRRTGGLRC